jgi:hypothetical protein
MLPMRCGRPVVLKCLREVKYVKAVLFCPPNVMLLLQREHCSVCHTSATLQECVTAWVYALGGHLTHPGHFAHLPPTLFAMMQIKVARI